MHPACGTIGQTEVVPDQDTVQTAQDPVSPDKHLGKPLVKRAS